MSSSHLSVLLAGAMGTGYAVIGAFFLRFWRSSRDDLFMAFAVAFWLMAAGQLVTGGLGLSAEALAPVYLLRLTAFSLILIAIVRKNLSDRSGR